MDLVNLKERIKRSLEMLRRSKAGMKALSLCHVKFFLSYKKVIKNIYCKDRHSVVFRNHINFMAEVCRHHRKLKEHLDSVYLEIKRYTGTAKSVYASLKTIAKKQKDIKCEDSKDVQMLAKEVGKVEKKAEKLAEKALDVHKTCMNQSVKGSQILDTTSKETSEKNAEKELVEKTKRIGIDRIEIGASISMDLGVREINDSNGVHSFMLSIDDISSISSLHSISQKFRK